MKCERLGTASRKLRVSELSDVAPDGTPIRVTDLVIEIRYTDDGPYAWGVKAIALDHAIIPAIVAALNGEG